MRRGLIIAGAAVALVAVGLSFWMQRPRARAPLSQTAAPGAAVPGTAVPAALERAEFAITRMDLDEAEKILAGLGGAEAQRARARLAIYRADCEGATAFLDGSQARQAPGARELGQFAERCAGATVDGQVVEDKARGVWIRFQDRADEVLAPLLFDAVSRARDVIEKELGTRLPRPLRLDLVRDLFSLSAVSGLPLDAAETTGTVAVARWGRVTMISPRAMARGYPWQDTVAHEITHLVLSRATADRAPLWLQEGVAKREETRWRPRRPFDRKPEPALTAYQAQVSGNSVGVDRLGPSIAMLPSADAAGIAFAEVTSFVEFWLEQNGPAALPLLLSDVLSSADTEQALLATSGLGLSDWQVRWRHALGERFTTAGPISTEPSDESELGPRRLGQVQRLTELLFVEGFAAEARARGAPELEAAPHAAALAFLVARSAYAAGEADAARLLGAPDGADHAHGGFLALAARVAPGPAAAALDAHALALDPLLPEVACQGTAWPRGQDPGSASSPNAERKRLCEHTRSLPVRGAE